jgi:titin
MKTKYFTIKIFISCLFSMIAIKADAATFTVTNTLDAGTGSLRQAITSANTNPMDADNIVFNIPTSDPNYNAATGVFTITLATLLPTVNSISVSVDGTTQSGNTNPDGPEICIKSTTNLTYALAFPFSGGFVKGLIINGFQMGIIITKYGTYPSGSCTVSNCYIGVNYDGSIAVPNDMGVALYGDVASNTIKDNLISGNTTAGIAIRRSNSNTIQGNKIGCDRTGMFAIPNYYGVAIDSSASNLVGGTTALQRNLISGNDYAGVAINTNISHDNTIKGNYIGINVNGVIRTDTVPNYYGIAINDSYNNIIGGATAAERNIISGNTDGGISILGSNAKNTTIKGNYIGTNVGGTDSIPNATGILLSGTSQNTIGGSNAGEGNLISGNTLAGIIMAYSGTRLNTVLGNKIGTDYQGTQILSNYTGVYIKSNANKNTIGGSTSGARNVISGNLEMGLCIESSDSNTIKGNYIGPDATGLNALKLSNDTLIQANGLYFNSNAKYNTAGGYNAGEGNVISGNRVYGHDLYGNSSYNSTIGNYIGVDATGNNPMPNATGICVDGGSNHNPFINNVLSGNRAYGMFIVTTGSDYNQLSGNKIGTNAAGTDTVPNQIGLILGGGTKHNIIGGTAIADRNIISGNRFDGIEVADIYTSYNDIKGNYIGTDINGTAALPNYIGIGFATKPSKNNIENNVISGNKYLGIIFYEHSDSNTVYTNKIGVAANGTSPLKNNVAGIVIAKASKYNKIGTLNKGNIIANHDSTGIAVIDTGTVFNSISANQIYNNGILGIDLYPYGVNNNDALDSDNGSNEQMNFPVIQNVFLAWQTGITTIDGTIDCATYGGPVGIKIELFKSNGSNMFNHGDATSYLGETVVSSSSGNWSFNCTGLVAGDMVTATATDIHGNTSEFAQNSDITVGIKETAVSNQYFVYPNPASNQLNIIYSASAEKLVNIKLYSITGELIKVFVNKNISSGNVQLKYNLSELNLEQGLYFISITENGVTVKTGKVIITK